MIDRTTPKSSLRGSKDATKVASDNGLHSCEVVELASAVPHIADSCATALATPSAIETPIPIDARSILDAMQDAVIASNRQNCVLYANAAAERLLGYASGIMTGLPIATFVPPRLRDLHLE